MNLKEAHGDVLGFQMVEGAEGGGLQHPDVLAEGTHTLYSALLWTPGYAQITATHQFPKHEPQTTKRFFIKQGKEPKWLNLNGGRSSSSSKQLCRNNF